MARKTKTKRPTIALRKPPAPVDAASFVTGRPAGDTKTTTYTRKTGANVGQELRRATLYLPADLFKRAKVAAVEADRPFSEIVADALRVALAK